MSRPRRFASEGDLVGVRVIAAPTPLPLTALPTEEGEEWRYLPHSDAYAVSSHGRLARTLPAKGTHVGRIIKPKSAGGRRGDYAVCLSIGNEQTYSPLRRLVYVTFVGPIPPGLDVVLRNDDANDCSPANLTLADHGLVGVAAAGAGMLSRRGERSPRAKLTNAAVREIRAAPAATPHTVLAARYGVSANTIRSVRIGKHWPDDAPGEPSEGD